MSMTLEELTLKMTELEEKIEHLNKDKASLDDTTTDIFGTWSGQKIKEEIDNSRLNNYLVNKGMVELKEGIPALDYVDYEVKFTIPYEKNIVPMVIVGTANASTAYQSGKVHADLLYGSVNNEGFIIRFYNADEALRTPAATWIALG